MVVHPPLGTAEVYRPEQDYRIRLGGTAWILRLILLLESARHGDLPGARSYPGAHVKGMAASAVDQS